MILKWLRLSIVLDVLSCQEIVVSLIDSLKKPTKGRGTVLQLKASCLGSFKGTLITFLRMRKSLILEQGVKNSKMRELT